MGDSKLKGPKWVGNIFQKFEAIYHEDTFKYVENQIQSVGKNMKKICADLLPATEHPDKHMAEDVASEKTDDVCSKTSKSWQKNSGHASENQSPAAPNDPATNQVSLVSNEDHLVDKLSSPTHVNTLVEESGSSLRMGKDDDITKNGTWAADDEEILEPILVKLMSNGGEKSFSESSVAIIIESNHENGLVNSNESDFCSEQNSSLDISEEVECVSGVSSVMISTTDAKVIDSEQQPSLFSSQCHLLDQLRSPACIDTLQVSGSNLCSEKSDGILTTESSDTNNEEFIIKRYAPVLSKSNSPAGVEDFTVLPTGASSQRSDANRHAKLFKDEPETPSHEVEFESLQNWTLCDDYANKIESAPDALDATSEMSFSVVSMENTRKDAGLASFSQFNAGQRSLRISESAPKMLTEETMFCHNSIAGVDFVSDFSDAAHVSDETLEHSLECQVLDSNSWDDFADETGPGISEHGLEFECHVSSPFGDKYSGDIHCVSSGPSKSTTSGVVCSIVSGENSAAETGVPSSSGSNANKFHRSTEIPPKMLYKEATFTYNSGGKGKCVSSCDESSLSAPILTASSKNKDWEGLLVNSYFTAEANSRSMETIPLPSPSGKSQVKICESVQHEAAVNSSGTECLDESSSDIDYCHMESIDLHDKVQIQENCVNVEDTQDSALHVDDSVLHAISRRVRKQRSYKKQIQDAFTSKKRLAKEYEQLAIWFGDVDLESSQKTNSDKHNSETHLAADSEWELL